MTNRDNMVVKIRQGWVSLELRKGELMREIWAIEARQEVLKLKLKSYGEFERALQELPEMAEDTGIAIVDWMDSNSAV